MEIKTDDQILRYLNDKYFDKVRELCDSNTLFLGFIVCNQRYDKNKCYMFCREHREVCTPIISNFLHRKRSGCKTCSRYSAIRKMIKEESIIMNDINNSCTALGCTFEGYVGGYKGSYNTIGRFRCNEHGTLMELNCRVFTRPERKTSGCFQCLNTHHLELAKEDNDRHIKEFLATGKFHPDTDFERDEVKTTKAGARNYWKVTCGGCGENYTSFIGSLKNGQVGCDCNKFICVMGYYPERVEWEDTLYLLRLTSKGSGNEDFYKIGRSFVFDRRIKNLKPRYNVEVISTIKDVHQNIYDKEKNLLHSCHPFSYQPLISFGGQTECFTAEILTHPEIISTFSLTDTR